MKKVLLIMMLGLMFGQFKKYVSDEESIKIEIIAKKHASEDIKIFINKKKYYVPEKRILDFNKNYDQELYYIYEATYLKKIDNDVNIIKMGKNIILPIGAFACGTLLTLFIILSQLVGFDNAIKLVF